MNILIENIFFPNQTAIKALQDMESEIKKVKLGSEANFISYQSIKHLRQKLESEKEFIPELRNYIKRQASLVKNKKPNILPINNTLKQHYLNVVSKITKKSEYRIKNDLFLYDLILKRTSHQSSIIDDNTQKEIEKSIQLARETEEGLSGSALYRVASVIFYNRMQSRLPSILTTETQGIYELTRNDIMIDRKKELESVVLDRNIERAEEIAEETESYTANKISEMLKSDSIDNQIIIALIVTMQKTWQTMGDLKVREVHQFANGQRVNIDDYFIVGGELLQYPGDSRGSVWNIVNCRCSAVYL